MAVSPSWLSRQPPGGGGVKHFAKTGSKSPALAELCGARGAESLSLGQVAEEEEARRCHRLGRRTGTNAMGWLAGLVARPPLPWRAVQGQTHPLSLQAAVAAAVSEESALLAAIAIASCCC